MINRIFAICFLFSLSLLLSSCFDSGKKNSTHYVFGALEGSVQHKGDRQIVDMVYMSEKVITIEQEGQSNTEGQIPFGEFITKWKAQEKEEIVAAMTYNFEETGFDSNFAVLKNPRFDENKGRLRFEMEEVPANYDRLKIQKRMSEGRFPMQNVTVFVLSDL